MPMRNFYLLRMTWDPSQRAIDEAFGHLIKLSNIVSSSGYEEIEARTVTTRPVGDEIVIVATTCSRGQRWSGQQWDKIEATKKQRDTTHQSRTAQQQVRNRTRRR